MELKYTALKQLLTTALAISIGQLLLTYLPLGFNDLMEGYFPTLCVGYGLYAIANTMMLILLLFYRLQGSIICNRNVRRVYDDIYLCVFILPARCTMDLDFYWEVRCSF